MDRSLAPPDDEFRDFGSEPQAKGGVEETADARLKA